MKSEHSLLSKIRSCFDRAPNRTNFSRPFVTLSYAQSIDGSIAYRPGRPLALSCRDSLTLTHQLRSIHDGILVGIGTILADDPYLTVRHINEKSPQPIIVDGRLRFPLDAHALKHHNHAPWIATGEKPDLGREQALINSGAKVIRTPISPDGLIDLTVLLKRLLDMNIKSLMVEGGAEIITSFLKHRLVDQLVLTISPFFIGGMHSIWPMQLDRLNPPVLENMSWEMCGSDIVVRADIAWKKP
jgi:3,4-dihydroxy 2-butanone 4-phosphate synthase/GTP cyclohydrolase II